MPITQNRMMCLIQTAQAFQNHHLRFIRQIKATIDGLQLPGGHLHTAALAADTEEWDSAFHHTTAALNILMEIISTDSIPIEPQLNLTIEQTHFNLRYRANTSAAARQQRRRNSKVDQKG
jgi:hypothetical protein